MGKLIILANMVASHALEYTKVWGPIVDLEFSSADRLMRNELFPNLVVVVRTTAEDTNAKTYPAPRTSYYFAEKGLLLGMYIHA